MGDHTFIMYNQEIVISDELARGTKLGFLIKNNIVESSIEDYYRKFLTSSREITKPKIILSSVGIYFIKLLDVYYSGYNRNNKSLSLSRILKVRKILK